MAALGAVLARFRPLGMARAMAATGIAQIFAFVVALATGLGFTGPITVFFLGAMDLILLAIPQSGGRMPDIGRGSRLDS